MSVASGFLHFFLSSYFASDNFAMKIRVFSKLIDTEDRLMVARGRKAGAGWCGAGQNR